MNPMLSQRCHQVVESALELPADQQSAFLDRECGGDPAVRTEVEALLAQAVLAASTVDAPEQAATIDHPTTVAQPDLQLNIPGFRILKTLGKGGMGVVYQAQDLNLPRQVALKMIKAGSDADEKQRLRFQAEAAAVAQLVHPHIVQIHAIGVHAGQPYFVLEYVDGGTLAQKLHSAPPTVRQAAEITMALAKAVQFAHQHGIIHRDLKPANVLLTPEGNPKITDFGLAKQLDADQALSLAGDIMGTPSYMAPEQAFGRVQDIVPATDVYALGAMLYEMLTGQPPFHGSTTLETLDLVRQQEPVPLRRLQPSVPRDLETICLKCLRKDGSQRYISALGLAQDLERFLAGEAILARPEGVLAKVSRKVRRNRAVSLLGLALVIALAATGLVVYRAGDASRIQDLESRLEAERAEIDWPDAKIKDHEALLERLAALAPDRAEPARTRFHQSLLDSGTKRLQQPTTLLPEEEAHVQRMIALLTARDAPRMDRLQRTYQTRMRAWEEVFKYALLKRDDVNLQKYADAAIPRVLTKQPCQGNVRLEAAWDGWEKTSQVGLALHGDPARQTSGYTFVLETLEGGAAAAGVPKPTFDKVRRQDGEVQLQILRNGVSLRKLQIGIAKLPMGPLRLESQREGDRLRMIVNQEVALETRDLIPLAPHGFYGIVWPGQAVVQSLRGLRQALPIVPGPLERGDELFAQGQLDDARAFYSQQAIALVGTPAGLEARYKEALALDHLQRKDDASRGYQALAAEMNATQANKWTVLASFQLLVHHLRNQKMNDADAILESLLFHRSRDSDENLMLYIPDEVRSEILGKYRDSAVGIGLWRHDPKRVQNTKRLVQLEELLAVPIGTREYTLLALVRVLRVDGQLDHAILTVEGRLAKIGADGSAVVFLAEYGWMMRENGTPSGALPGINRLLTGAGVHREGAMTLYIERARLRAAMNEWDGAQKDLDEFFRLAAEAPPSYRNWSDACLMLGMVREERGDLAGALEAWRKGKYKDDLNDPHSRDNAMNGMALTNVLLLDSLCRDLDEKRVEALFHRVVRKQGGIEAMLNLVDTKSFFSTSTAIMNRMWYTPNGKECARKMVLQTCRFQDFMRYPVQVFTVEMARTESIAGETSPDQEELLWKFAEAGTVAFASGKLSEVQAMQLALLWKRGPTFLGGVEILKGFDPALRGPAAYFMGLRFQRLGRPTDEVFRIALENAPANSILQRLTRAELEKMSKKK